MRGKILYLGLSGFPIGLAAIQRQLLISKSLERNGWKVLILNSKPVHVYTENIPRLGFYEGIRYFYLFGSIRPSSIFKRFFFKIIKPLAEFKFLLSETKYEKFNAAIVTNRNLLAQNVWYYFLSKVFKFKLIINLVEDYTNRPGRTVSRYINDYLFSKYGLYFSDGYLPISEYIIAQNIKFKKPYLYTPVLVDSSYFDVSRTINSENYFLYCGSVLYIDAIKFILDAFDLLDDSTTKLILVLNGEKGYFDRINDRIQKSAKCNLISVYTKLPYCDLVVKYKNALGLILPMFNTVQDQARFPHKLGEYLASGNPVITANIGEVGKFIENKNNGLIYEVNNRSDLCSNLNWIIQNPKLAAEIGKNGYKTMLTNFELRYVGIKLNEFILNL